MIHRAFAVHGRPSQRRNFWIDAGSPVGAVYDRAQFMGLRIETWCAAIDRAYRGTRIDPEVP